MSFAFMPWYTGDYLRDTRHLTPQKHGVYLLLLAHCWDQKGPVPLDEQEAAGIANCRSSDEIDSLRYVMDRYFVRMEDGWYNGRMQAEVVRAEEISTKREDAGRRGANERMRRLRLAQASAKQVLSKSLASDATPTPTPTLTTTLTPTLTPTTKTPRSKDCAPTAPSGVGEQVWADFLQTRKQLRAAVTPTAIKGIEREAAKAGLSLSEALQMCCARGWRGFKAEWVTQPKAGQKERVKAMLFGKEIDHETQ